MDGDSQIAEEWDKNAKQAVTLRITLFPFSPLKEQEKKIWTFLKQRTNLDCINNWMIFFVHNKEHYLRKPKLKMLYSRTIHANIPTLFNILSKCCIGITLWLVSCSALIRMFRFYFFDPLLFTTLMFCFVSG